MDLAHALRTYGYWVVLVGTFLEGEMVLVLAGFAARRGYLNIWLVIAAAIAGSYLGDQLYFYIGRRFGLRWMARHPRWRRRTARVLRLLERWDAWFIVGFRFLYGLRTASPIALALSGVPAGRFAVLNAVGAVVWAIAFAWLGYALGQTVQTFIGRVQHQEGLVLLVVAGLGLLIWAWRAWRTARRND